MATSKHTYDYEIDLSSDVAPARVIKMVQPKSRVLEIGAGPGSVTKHLAGTLSCSVVALEVEATAIEKLRTVVPNVYALDLNRPDWVTTISEGEGLFDYVIAADVLEHVLDPSAVLGGMKRLLNNNGSVILSLPHAGHASVVACLLDENFDYQNWGLLDRTHVRFFGVKNIEQLLRSQGMAIEHGEFVVRTPEMTEFAKRWRRMPIYVRRAILANKFSQVYQVVTRTVPIERCVEPVSLFDVAVEAPDHATRQHWQKTMGRLRLASDVDSRTTFGTTSFSPESSSTSVASSASPASRGVRPGKSSESSHVRLIAYYLTQFHPIPENDLWWGTGFTEWTNVTKARPTFQGHYQPHLPADLGFYDLRLRETRRQQISLAKRYGIDGFCYYYYWFSGRKLLERPLEDMLADRESDMPFMLMWANENWTRRWDASEKDVLIEQYYRPEDDLEFIKSLMPYLKDDRYIKVKGSPIIAVYRPQEIPDPARCIATWRRYCAEQGVPSIHVACAYSHGNWDHKQYGFDSGIEFPPHNIFGSIDRTKIESELFFFTQERSFIFDYSSVADFYLGRRYGSDSMGFRCVFPSWDNTSRRKSGSTVVLNSTPENYEWWLSQAVKRTRASYPEADALVFINAWNEWAESAHLEPDQRYGHAFLEATLRAKHGTSLKGWSQVGVPNECCTVDPVRIYQRKKQPAHFAPEAPKRANTTKSYLRNPVQR